MLTRHNLVLVGTLFIHKAKCTKTNHLALKEKLVTRSAEEVITFFKAWVLHFSMS